VSCGFALFQRDLNFSFIFWKKPIIQPVGFYISSIINNPNHQRMQWSNNCKSTYHKWKRVRQQQMPGHAHYLSTSRSQRRVPLFSFLLTKTHI
jgi:hypothetical protein